MLNESKLLLFVLLYSKGYNFRAWLLSYPIPMDKDSLADIFARLDRRAGPWFGYIKATDRFPLEWEHPSIRHLLAIECLP